MHDSGSLQLVSWVIGLRVIFFPDIGPGKVSSMFDDTLSAFYSEYKFDRRTDGRTELSLVNGNSI